MSTNIVEARAALQRAEHDEATQRRAKLIEQLGQVHANLEKAQADYLRLAGQIKAEREAKAAIRGQMDHVIQLIAEHAKHCPVVAAYLPDDAGVIAWTKHRDALDAMHAQLIVKLNAVPTTSIIAAVHFEGPTGLIATLQYSENNLLAALDPESRRKWFEGGIFAVS